jgi:Gpi18-like mannosyltransferase
MNRKALLNSIIIVIIWRIVTSGVFFLLAQIMPTQPLTLKPEHMIMYDALRNGSFFDRNFLLPWFRWDTFHYVSIALRGYTTMGQSVWPPLFPLLIALISCVGIHPLESALLISTLAAIYVFYALQLLAADLSYPEPRNVLFYAITFPVAFYLLAGYSDALFMALSLACFRFLSRKKFWLAGILAILATLTRQMGLLLAVPIVVEGLRGINFRRNQLPLRRIVTVICCASFPFLAFILFNVSVQIIMGSGDIFHRFSLYGKHSLVFPGWGIVQSFINIYKGVSVLNPFSLGIDSLLCLLACILLIMGLTRKDRIPLSYLAYMGVNLLVILMYLIDNKPLVSSSRYLLVLFPMYFLQAKYWNGRITQDLWFAFSLVCTLFMFVGFYAWLWVE